MEFCWDGRVVDTVMKLMHHNFNFFHGGRCPAGVSVSRDLCFSGAGRAGRWLG
jgi:hypothetical protein